MSALKTTCPPESVLNDFGLGKLDAVQADTISRHLETCADCRQRVAGISGDTFVGRLRQADGAAKPTERRERTYVPGESLANAANSTDGSSAREDGLPRPSRKTADARERDALGSPSSVSGPPELTNHPDYELIKELGQGGMGTVYLAKNRMMDRPEVLKVISTALLARPGALERFQQEIRSAARLAHPNIVAAYSVLRPGDLLVFAMEYVRGQDLSQVVKQRGPLPVANAAFYIHQVANGLQHAHEKGMVHRDIKPNNLMLAIEGKKHVVKILDFGLAKASSEKSADAGLTKSGQMLGTPDYVAPEQTLDAHKADTRADIYSLGCTLYFLLSGGPPFQEASLYEILEAHHKRDPKPLNIVRPEVPVELSMVVAKMMAKDPAKRYQTPAEVAKALVPFFKPGQSVATPPLNTGQSHVATDSAQRISVAGPPPIVAPPRVPIPLAIAAPPVAVPTAPADAAVAVRPAILPAAGDSFENFSRSIDTQRRVAPASRGGWSSLPPWQRMTAFAAAGAAAALLLGIVFLVQTKDGAIRVEINDPKIEVAIKGTQIVLKQADNGRDIKLSPGEKTLIVERGDFKFETDNLVLKKDETVTVAVTLVNGEIRVMQGEKETDRRKLRPDALPPALAASNVPPNGGAPKRFSFEISDPHLARWWLDGDELVQSSHDENISIIFGDAEWEDVDFSVEAKLTGGNDLCAMLCRYQNEGNVDWYQVGAYGNTWHLSASMDGDTYTRTGQRAGSLVVGQWYQLEFRMRGNRGECYLDGEQILSLETKRPHRGRAGLSTTHAAYRFRNIMVKAPDGKVLLEGLPGLDAEPPAQAYEDDYKKVLAARRGSLPVGTSGRALNLDFETGSLQDWIVNGDAFTGQPAKGDALRAHYKYLHARHSGQFWLGGYENADDKAKGTLTSVPFKVTKPFASFLMAGGGPIGVDAAVELLERDVREPFLRVIGNGSDTLQPVAVDLTQQVGKEIVIRLADQAEGPAGHVSFDDFRLHDSMPDFSPQYVRANAIPFGQTTDVLKLVDVKRDSRSGAWYRDGQNRLVVPSWGWKMLQVPVAVPDEYDLAFTIEGFPGLDAIHVILPVGDHQTLLKLNGWSNPIVSGLERIDGTPVFNNESTHRGTVLLEGKPNTVLCQVRAGSIKAICNGETIFDWHGDFKRLSLPWGAAPSWATVAGYHGILIGGRRAGFRLSQLEITAFDSQSKTTAGLPASSDLQDGGVPAKPMASPTTNVAKAERFPCEIPLWARGLWSIEGDELVQKSCDRGGAHRPNMPAVCMFFGDRNWADYDFAFDAKPIDGWDLRTHFRYQDDLNNHSYVTSDTYQIVDIMEGGKFGNRLTEGPFAANGEWRHVHVSIRGNKGTCFLNGQKVLREFNIARHDTGCVGFSISNAASFRFRNIVVKDPDGKVLLEGLPDIDHAARPTFPGDASLADDRKITAPTQRTNLLGLVRLPHDALIGSWRKTGQGIQSDATIGAKLQFLCRPAGEYDLQVTFSRTEGNEWMALALCHRDARFAWWLGSHKNKFCGIASINGWFSASNSTSFKRDPMFENGPKYTAVVKIRDDSISTYLGGVQLGQDLNTDYSNVSGGLDAAVAPNLLAIYTASPFIVHEAEIIPVSNATGATMSAIKPASATARSTPASSRRAARTDAFIPLLNGRDLKGWLFVKRPGGPRFDESAIQLAGNDDYFLTNRYDFKDFTLRMQMSASQGTEAMVAIRQQGAGSAGTAITSRIFDDGKSIRAGMQWLNFAPTAEIGTKRASIPYDQFFTLELRIKGQYATVTIDGAETSNNIHHPGGKAEGALGVVLHKGKLSIRKIEVKESP